MHALRRGIILFSLATVLCACGGTGSASGSPSLSPITYTSMNFEVSTIRRSSDTLLMTDISLTHPSVPRGHRAPTVCTFGLCQAYFSDYKLADISLFDFEFSDRTDDHRFFTSIGLVKMADIRGRNEEDGVTTDFKNLGGWLTHSAFAVEVNSIVSGVSRGVDLAGTMSSGAYSFGDATGTTPAFGNATWTGTMVGSDTSLTATRGNRVIGNAALTFDLSRSDIDVAFTFIRDIDGGRPHGNITWRNVPVTSGSFSTGFVGSSIDGRFYGRNHEEVGGVFERNQIAGAFGAKR